MGEDRFSFKTTDPLKIFFDVLIINTYYFVIGFFSKKYMDEMNNKMSFWGDNLKIYHFCSIHYITRTVD